MRIRFFSDNTPKIDGISADITLDVELETADSDEIYSSIYSVLLHDCGVGSAYAVDIAQRLTDELQRNYELVRK